MAIQYYMRAYNTSTLQYVDWVVNDRPDKTGVYAPGGNTNLVNITVNRQVQSKVNNFVQPVNEASYITNVSYNNPQDGYLFHLNSYDWLNPVASNATGPITIPSLSQPIGISIVRGSASTGIPFTPSSYASLFWEEGTQQWNFAFINSNGSIGTPLAVSMGPSIIDGYSLIDGYLVIIPAPNTPFATTGAIRLSNAESIVTRNAANTADLVTIATDSNNNTIVGNPTQNVIIGGTGANIIGSPSANTTTIAGNLLVLGNSTTVESTTVDIVGRVIHGNYSTAQNVSPPSMIAGYSIHRGAGATNQNDGAGLIWIEGSQVVTGSDGFWLTATITQDIDTVTQATLPNIVKVMTGGVYVASNAQPVLTTLPTVGGLRTQNATTAVAARNAAGSTNLLLLGTDSGNHIVIGDTVNSGQIFNVSTGSSYVFDINSVAKLSINPATTMFSDSATALTVTPVSAGTTQVTYASTVTAAQINQTATASATGATMTVQAQNALTTGGAFVLSTGTAVTAGSLHLQTGGVDQILITPTLTTVTNNTIIDGTLTVYGGTGNAQVQILQDNIVFSNTDGYATISQAPSYVASATGAALTIAAQSVFGSNGIGGNLILSSGFGGLIDGYIDLQVSGITVAAVEPNKFTFVQGQRRHVTRITGTYNVSLMDDFIAITTLTSPFSIYLPAFPAIGDTYEIKDATGSAGTFPVTVNGNGANIDGTSTFALAQPYAATTFTFTGTTWSIT